MPRIWDIITDQTRVSLIEWQYKHHGNRLEVWNEPVYTPTPATTQEESDAEIAREMSKAPSRSRGD